ncbi:RnfABCDGE type electron transport complex subunit D [Candidatus Bathycorpusculum sp.]|jgi:electron transport complex protein RnfD|uniref:RnfABCDGE type electron transport complex subunit D n=1 Tax=Candidatus Bathycorpusculum sp. TaxID=2994959 RepID=UPI00282E7B9F|nr:RnfABCDGE type electron transport complex subunit D [Candidatus Termitimicrobium sp.]MCL2685157.1 RnfABCDGE type electron transport complex subunit D [Candidatus Termitimicrobium sp.]
MSNESSNELVVNPAPHIHGSMTKDRMMQYTFIAILAVTIVSAVLWSDVVTPSGWNLGLTVAIGTLIAVGLAVAIDFLIGKVTSDSEVNTWSAAVFGLIVINCFTLGFPSMAMGMEVGVPVEAPLAFFYIALISIIGIVVFKKVASIAGRKLVNPAAAAKFLVLIPTTFTTLITSWHLSTGMLMVPSLAGPIGSPADGLGTAGNGYASFGAYLQGCFGSPNGTEASVESIMLLTKYHGWVGGASSIAVIIAGVALFVVGRKYFKWKITASYLIAMAATSLIFSFIFGDVDLITRLLFSLFAGSSIFLAFFMATDPATTPFSGTGQIIFGVGLAILTISIQTFMGFFGGSLLALLIMNLLVPVIDKVRINKPFGR